MTATCLLRPAIIGLGALLISNVASAATATFTYSVTGQGNPVIDPATLILSYAFVPFAPSSTPLGPLLVSYSGDIDLTLTPPSGPTAATFDFGALGTFFGPGLEFIFATDPSTGIAPFAGTTTITGGTGVFAGASGSTSYTGLFNVVTGVATFTERVTVTGPDVPAVPAPGTLLLLTFGLGAVGAAFRQRIVRKGRHTD